MVIVPYRLAWGFPQHREDGEGQRTAKGDEVSRQRGFTLRTGIERAKQHHSRQRHHHAQQFPPGEPFQALDTGQQQNQDRRSVCEDRRMRHTGVAQTENEQELVEGHAEHA
jgi:hypothetical protein